MQETPERRSYDQLYLSAHIQAAATAARLEAHVDEDIRRFEGIGREIGEVKESVSDLGTKMDNLRGDVGDLHRRYAWIIGGLLALAKAADWIIHYLIPVIHIN
jgi:hypothetical protein